MSEYTILLPFYAKQENTDLFLKVINFYKHYNLKNNIIVALSGDKVNQNIVKDQINIISSKVEIIAFDPDDNSSITNMQALYRKLSACAAKVSSQFTVLLAGDDFILPDCINICCEVLNNDSGVVAASGKGILYNRLHKQILIYPQIERTKVNVIERLTDYVANPTAVFYSVYRTADLNRIFCHAERFVCKNELILSKNMSFSEHIFSIFVLLHGKIAVVDELFIIRTQHQHQAGRFTKSVLDSYMQGEVDEFIDAAVDYIFHHQLVSGVSAKAFSDCLRKAYLTYLGLKGSAKILPVIKSIFRKNVKFKNTCLLLYKSLAHKIINTHKDYRLDPQHKTFLTQQSFRKVLQAYD